MKLPDIGTDNDRFLAEEFKKLIRKSKQPVVFICAYNDEDEKYEARVYYETRTKGRMAVYQAEAPEIAMALGIVYRHMEKVLKTDQRPSKGSRKLEA